MPRRGLHEVHSRQAETGGRIVHPGDSSHRGWVWSEATAADEVSIRIGQCRSRQGSGPDIHVRQGAADSEIQTSNRSGLRDVYTKSGFYFFSRGLTHGLVADQVGRKAAVWCVAGLGNP